MSGAPVGLLLAAGRSRRFGSNKLTEVLADGCPVAIRSAERLIAAVPDAVAVISDVSAPLAGGLSALGFRVLVNRRPEAGLSHSLTLGVTHGTPVGWVVALADMPWIKVSTIALVASGLREGASLVAPEYQGRRGHPVGLARCWRHAICGLTGDRGARAILAANLTQLLRVSVDDPGVLRDIDRPADLRDAPEPALCS